MHTKEDAYKKRKISGITDDHEYRFLRRGDDEAPSQKSFTAGRLLCLGAKLVFLLFGVCGFAVLVMKDVFYQAVSSTPQMQLILLELKYLQPKQISPACLYYSLLSPV